MTVLISIVVIPTSLDPASAIIMSIATILVSFEAILKRFSVRINYKSQFQSNDLPQALKYIKIASKLTSIVTILANIGLAGEHIFKYWLNTREYYHITHEYCHNTCYSIEQVNTSFPRY